jgi:TolB protein
MRTIALLCLLLAATANAQDRSLVAEHAKFKARSNYTPQWSPDGKRLVFNSHIDGIWRVMVANVDGSDLHAITPPSQDSVEPTWSPDGKSIAFVIRNAEKVGDIYVMATDGSGVRSLTHEPADETMPRWSPDGKRIAYISKVSGKGALWIMKSDGSDQRELVDVKQYPVPWRFAWSPDGKQILFFSTTDGEAMSSKNQWQGYLVDVGSGKVTKAGLKLGRESNPSWNRAGLLLLDGNPDGSFASAKGQFEVFSTKVDGSEHRQLTRNTRNDWGPAWSADGKKIAYCSGFNDQYEIFIMNADGSEQRRVTYSVHPPDKMPQYEPGKD